MGCLWLVHRKPKGGLWLLPKPKTGGDKHWIMRPPSTAEKKHERNLLIKLNAKSDVSYVTSCDLYAVLNTFCFIVGIEYYKPSLFHHVGILSGDGQAIDWLGRGEHASGYMRCSCKGHEMGYRIRASRIQRS